MSVVPSDGAGLSGLPRLEFGVAVSTEADRVEELIRLAQLADRLGLELLGVMDHSYAAGNLDTWTLLAVLAARTDRIRLFPDVANLPLRPPAMLAKAVASLDLITGGRVELGLGAGALVGRGVSGMGTPERSPRQAVAALAEAITVIRHVWSGTPTPVHYAGEHYRLDGLQAGPVPAHPVGIWVGAHRPRMLALTGRLGDGWVASHPFIPPAEVSVLGRHVDAAAEAAGRSPRSVRRLYNIIGRVTPTGGSMFEEPVDAWVDRLTGLVLDHRVTGIQFVPTTDPARQVEIFAQEVVPAVREAVVRLTGVSTHGAHDGEAGRR